MPKKKFGEYGDVSSSVLVRVLGALLGYQYENKRRRLSKIDEETLFEKYRIVPADLTKFAGMPSRYYEIIYRISGGKEEAVKREDFIVYLISEQAILRLSGANERSVKKLLEIMTEKEIIVRQNPGFYKTYASIYLAERGLSKRRVSARAHAYYHVAPHVRKLLRNTFYFLAQLLDIEIREI